MLISNDRSGAYSEGTMEAPLPLDFLGTITPALRALVAHYEATLSPASFQSLIAHLGKLSVGYQATLSEHSPGGARARAVHRLLEAELKNSAHLPRSCTKGCGACCHLEVEITQDEGELLAQLILEGHKIDHTRLALQAGRERKGAAWTERVTPANRCVFLDDSDSCGIYESRPGVCRKVLVTSAPADCADPGAVAQPILIPLAELILSTALSLPGNSFSSISKSVSQGLSRFAELKAKSQEFVSNVEQDLLELPESVSRG